MLYEIEDITIWEYAIEIPDICAAEVFRQPIKYISILHEVLYLQFRVEQMGAELGVEVHLVISVLDMLFHWFQTPLFHY
jgi:hypothetical protein